MRGSQRRRIEDLEREHGPMTDEERIILLGPSADDMVIGGADDE